MTAGKSVTSKNRSIKLTSLFVALGLIFSLLNFLGVSTAQAEDWTPPTLPPVLSADGLSLANGVPLLLIKVDPNPAMRGIQVKRDPEIQAAIEAAVADPEAVNASFSITYKAAGTSDPWGAVCAAFPDAAKTAFNAAAAIWTATIQSSVPITISACWSNLGSSSILGYSGGAYIYRNFTGAPKTNVWYESSLANALHGSDLGPSYFDDHITYNSNFSWYYGTDGVVPAGQYDLVTVAAHEIAHGLNFSGSADVSGTTGSLGYSGDPYIYDTFMEDSGGTKLTSYTNPSTALGSVLTGNSLWFNGVNSKAANGGTRVKMYAPGTWSGGSSYSHLDYTTFAGTANSMMVYSVSSGASQHNPGAVTKGILKDMGWVLVGTTPTVPTPISPSGTITDRTPTFKWSKVTGATQYGFQVYRGTTLVYTKTVTSAACGTTYCNSTPTTLLNYAAHKWHVRAYVGGAWKTYSVYKNFTVASAPSGFNSTFNGSSAGWSAVKGAWSIYSAMYYRSTGLTDKFASAKHTGLYGNYTYEVRMKRSGETNWANTLFVRGTPTSFTSYYDWKPSYQFTYSNGGSFSVWKINSAGTATALKSWTTSSYIVKNGWNTLKVITSGSSLKFYINNHLVWSGSDAMKLNGQVGVGFYRDITAGTLLVDWAKLTSSSPDENPFSDFELVTPGVEIPGGTNYMAP